MDISNLKDISLRKNGKPSKAKKTIVKGLRICVAVGFIIACVTALYVMIFLKPYSINLNDTKVKTTSILYANDTVTGKPAEFAEISGDENRIWVGSDNTPEDLKNAIISTEDQRFYKHNGVDFKRTISAFGNMIFHFYKSNQGGSTLTQQLIKNLEGNIFNRTPSIKIREIITALDLEKKYSKDQILEAYMNTIGLGNNCFGVQTAANMYFGKDVKNLDLAQCALLAGIIQSPNGFEPYKNVKKALIRQKYVLKNMYSQKLISQAAYTSAIKEKLTFVPKKTTVNNWFVDQVITDVTSDLMTQKGYSKENAQIIIYTQGLKIYTTENPKIQADMDEVYLNNKYFDDGLNATTGKEQYFNSGMMIVDYSGRVMGVEGARGAKKQNMVLNHASQTYRQAGSCFKPICSYGPAIELGLINWSTMFMDDAVLTVNGQPWPRDEEGWSYASQTVDTALSQSMNTVAVRIEKLVKPSRSFDFLTQKLGFSESLSKDVDANGDSDYSSLGLTLGQFSAKSKGVSVREMAGAYEIFGNGGVYNKPYTYTTVQNANGTVLLQNKPSSVQAISPETSTIMNKLMQNVVTNGTGGRAQIDNVPVAGKTGTTSDDCDRWWIGLTPEYVGAVWTGYDTPKSIGNMPNPSVTIWKAVMEKVESDRDTTKYFPVSDNVVMKTYDVNTGELSSTGTGMGWYNINDTAVTSAKNNTNPPKDNAKPPKDNAKPPKDSAKPPKDNSKPSKDNPKPSKDNPSSSTDSTGSSMGNTSSSADSTSSSADNSSSTGNTGRGDKSAHKK